MKINQKKLSGALSKKLPVEVAGANAFERLSIIANYRANTFDVEQAKRLLSTFSIDNDDSVQVNALLAFIEKFPQELPNLLFQISEDFPGAFNRIKNNICSPTQSTVSQDQEQGRARLKLLITNPTLLSALAVGTEIEALSATRLTRFSTLRSSSAFAGLWSAIRSSRQLSFSYFELVENFKTTLDEKYISTTTFFLNNVTSSFKKLFASLCQDSRIAALFRISIDRHFEDSSDAIWNTLKKQKIPYVPYMIFGSGASSTRLASTLFTAQPSSPPLVVERDERAGGTFRWSRAPLWRLNSRNRLDNGVRLTTPGGNDSLNSLGVYAILQESNLSYQNYSDQTKEGDAIASTLSMSANTLLKTDPLDVLTNNKVTRNFFGLPDSTPGTFIVVLKKNAQTILVAIDQGVRATGIGEEKDPFASGKDPKMSDAILKEERAKIGLYKFPLVTSFKEFAQQWENPNFRDHVRSLCELAVLGEGDGGGVIIEAALGYGPDNEDPVVQRAQNVTINWVAQKATDKDSFCNKSRPRYSQLALEFPRPGYNSSRIKPTSAKGKDLQRSREKNRVILKLSDGTVLKTQLVVYSTGFKQEPLRFTLFKAEVNYLDPSFRDLPSSTFLLKLKALSKEQIKGGVLLVAKPINAQDNYIEFKISDAKNLQITTFSIENDKKSTRKIDYDEKVTLTEPITYDQLSQLIATRELVEYRPYYDDKNSDLIVEPVPTYAEVDGVRIAMANCLARNTSTGGAFWEIGPGTNLPISTEQKAVISVDIPQNTVALWKNGPGINALGEILATQTEPSQRPTLTTLITNKSTSYKVNVSDNKAGRVSVYYEGFKETLSELRGFPKQLLILVLQRHLAGIRLKKGGSILSFRCEIETSKEKAFMLSLESNISNFKDIPKLHNAILKDELFPGVIIKLGRVLEGNDKRKVRSIVEFNIPSNQNGRILFEDISAGRVRL